MQVPPNSWLRVGDISRLTGLAPALVKRLIDDGDLVSSRTPGGHRIVLASSVEEYLADVEMST